MNSFGDVWQNFKILKRSEKITVGLVLALVFSSMGTIAYYAFQTRSGFVPTVQALDYSSTSLAYMAGILGGLGLYFKNFERVLFGVAVFLTIMSYGIYLIKITALAPAVAIIVLVFGFLFLIPLVFFAIDKDESAMAAQIVVCIVLFGFLAACITAIFIHT